MPQATEDELLARPDLGARAWAQQVVLSRGVKRFASWRSVDRRIKAVARQIERARAPTKEQQP
jgi:hypothetical protein